MRPQSGQPIKRGRRNAAWVPIWRLGVNPRADGHGARSLALSASTETKTKAKSSPVHPVPVLDRGLDILEALSNSGTPLSLSDLARALNQTASSVFRLLNRLERRAYVIRDPLSGQYSLSLKLFQLAHSHSSVGGLLRVANAPMRELAELTGESVHLSVISNGRLVLLQDVGSPWRVRIAIEVGSRFPVVHTVSGRLLIAYLSPEDLNGFSSKDSDYAAMTEEQRISLQQELQNIRRNRYSMAASSKIPGVRDIAVLIGNPAIGLTAALGMACHRRGKDTADGLRLAKALQESAAKITLAQGLSL